MKIFLLAALVALRTASASITESAQIVSGNTVSVYLVNGTVVVSTIGDSPQPARLGGKAFLSVSFDSRPAWCLVHKVTWDKRHRQLTIDF